jgi:hypothetical protein
MAIPAIYDQARDFGDGLAPVKVDETWGFVDIRGHMAIPLKYYCAGSFSEGLGMVALTCVPDAGNGYCYTWGYVDTKGSMAVRAVACDDDCPPGHFNEGRAWVSLDGKYGCIDTKGNMVIPAVYDEEGEFFSDGLAYVMLNGKRFYIGLNGVQYWEE